MEIGLNVGERLVALDLLPAEGGIVTLRLVRELAGKLGLSAEELAEYGVKQDGQIVTWLPCANEPKSLSFKEKEVEVIAVALKALDEKGKLSLRQVSLWEKFVEVK